MRLLEVGMAGSWSIAEVEATVEDYFRMLCLELGGRKYNKSQHRRELIELLNNRSHAAVERKHQNISAVLIKMGMPYIDGYKPLSNYQVALIDAIKNIVIKSPDLHNVFLEHAIKVPVLPLTIDFSSILENPPVNDVKSPRSIKEKSAIYSPLGVNYLEMEAKNQLLGSAGEDFVIKYERNRLIQAGKESLAESVEQVSVSVGPSAGYDVHSYNANGTDRFIEVKATNYGKNTPFFLTPNELRFSQSNKNYFLYRVFKFESAPRMFTLQGDLQERCILKPSQYLVSVC